MFLWKEFLQRQRATSFLLNQKQLIYQLWHFPDHCNTVTLLKLDRNKGNKAKFHVLNPRWRHTPALFLRIDLHQLTCRNKKVWMSQVQPVTLCFLVSPYLLLLIRLASQDLTVVNKITLSKKVLEIQCLVNTVLF